MKKYWKIFRVAVETRKTYKKELTELQIKRMKICSTCPLNSANKDRKTLKEIFMVYLNKLFDVALGVYGNSEDICTDCGCNIEHKATQTEKELICRLGKWK